ncbi:2-amino-4-hydroxy-6-hydroxymethyldihydropteridine diphosphokinase [Marinigracilibium pacificum]|uniref:2-amino-4-hydroxy-6-hydroxymethyldihydropteridine pyrophosphokinase n=1 Tax=Marinigracilibium pacificum TaxID=2729599 RepID=A0A848J6X8_9BACT|nr:2-amino-4-hydroxy-6-hydroxymethyldihydropteridine diphosphokinase [Marinigracilibium pacificum]NMM50204.1 2-amino-4-hydroxy-6-hydroxymethyldihydropteridine diphosphokinase [Marinigracilibium pacificum]
MKGIYLLLGTNMGDRQSNLKTAAEKIEDQIGKILNYSSIYETAAWGKTDQPDFYNTVLEIEADISPMDLINKCLEIEKEMGRIRIEKWAERLIDIDILYMDDWIVKYDSLTIPHPRIQDRAFTLFPLTEIASEFIHPVLLKSQKSLLSECSDTLEVKKIDKKKPEGNLRA